MRPPFDVPVRAYVAGFLLLVGLQAVSGLALLVLYQPDPTGAHPSVSAIVHGPMSIVRGLHAWTAEATVIVAVTAGVHLFLSRSVAATIRPWLGGLVVLVAVLAAYLSGGVLSWDQQSWESYQHGAQAIGMRPEDPGRTPVAAVLVGHVLATIVIVGAIGWALGWDALRPRAAALTEVARSRAGLLTAVLLVALAILSPPAHGPAPVSGLAVSKPDWPFLWLVPVQGWFGALGVWALPAVGASVFLVGRVVRTASQPHRLAVVGAYCAILGALTIGGLLQ